MKNGIKIYLLIICLSILFVSCQKEGNPTEVEPDPTKDFKVVKTLTIDNKGGTIETDNVSFKIPANSLTSATELKILESEKLDITNNQVSNGVQLSGLPKGYNGVVKIKLKQKGTLSHETYITTVQITKHHQMGVNVSNIEYFETKDSSGFLIASRVYENYNQSKTLTKSSEIQDDIILAKSGLKREFSTKEPFFKIIYEPNNFSEAKVKVLIDALEKSYKIFNEIGFDLKNKKFKNYLKIDVTPYPKVGADDDLRYGYYDRPFPFLFNNSYISINSKKMTNNEVITATATHELFHYIQDLYGVNDNNKTYWLQEALSTWSEELAQDTPGTYIPEGFTQNMIRIFHGIEAGQNWTETGISAKKQFHGYGMSSFIKYMVNKSKLNDKRVFALNLLSNLEQKKANLESIKLAIGANGFTENLHGFFDKVMQGEVYGKNNSTSDAATIRANLSEQQNETKLFDIKTKADSMKNFSVNIENLGATVFKVNLTRDFTKEEILKLKFTTKGKYADHKYFVYKNVYGYFPVLIASGQCSSDEVTIQELKSISEEKHPNVTPPKITSLLILITNVDETKDVMGNTNFTLDLKVTQEKIDASKINTKSLSFTTYEDFSILLSPGNYWKIAKFKIEVTYEVTGYGVEIDPDDSERFVLPPTGKPATIKANGKVTVEPLNLRRYIAEGSTDNYNEFSFNEPKVVFASFNSEMTSEIKNVNPYSGTFLGGKDIFIAANGSINTIESFYRSGVKTSQIVKSYTFSGKSCAIGLKYE